MPGLDVALAAGRHLDRVGVDQVQDDRDVVHAERPEHVLVRADLAQVHAVAVHVAHVAQLAGVDQLAQLLDAGMEAQQVADHQHEAAARDEVAQLVRLGGRPGHRLLDHDVLAGQDRPPGELEVRRHGRRQHHRAHVGVGQDIVVARGEAGLRIGGRVRRAGLLVGVAAPAQVGLGQRAEVAQQVLAPPAQADHADGDALAHSLTTLPSAAGTAFRKSITSCARSATRA